MGIQSAPSRALKDEHLCCSSASLAVVRRPWKRPLGSYVHANVHVRLLIRSLRGPSSVVDAAWIPPLPHPAASSLHFFFAKGKRRSLLRKKRFAFSGVNFFFNVFNFCTICSWACLLTNKNKRQSLRRLWVAIRSASFQSPISKKKRHIVKAETDTNSLYLSMVTRFFFFFNHFPPYCQI